MKFIMLLLVLSVSFQCLSQNQFSPDSISQRGLTGTQAIYRSALVFVKSVNGLDTVISNGCGFIISNKYLATCYHVYRRDTSFKPIEIKVLYNIRPNPEAWGAMKVEYINTKDETGLDDLLYDSTYATLNYKTKRKQYDFKKHVYTGDMETDFIILKLSKTVKSIELVLDTTQVKSGDSFIASGLTLDVLGLRQPFLKRNYFASQEKVFFVFNPPTGSLIYATYGDIRQGYSGSPLFDRSGRIKGMVQKTVLKKDVDNELKGFVNEGIITQSQSDEITRMGRRDNYAQLGFSINIGYLLKKYMNGYY